MDHGQTDGITAAYIQQAGRIAINWLKKSSNPSWRWENYQHRGKKQKVVFIPKAGKATHATAKDLRPISITSFLLKSFERMISLHIRATVDPA